MDTVLVVIVTMPFPVESMRSASPAQDVGHGTSEPRDLPWWPTMLAAEAPVFHTTNDYHLDLLCPLSISTQINVFIKLYPMRIRFYRNQLTLINDRAGKSFRTNNPLVRSVILSALPIILALKISMFTDILNVKLLQI